MDRRMLDKALPVIFGALVALSALFFADALLPIAVVGGLLLGLYYVLLRPRLLGLTTDRRRA